MKLLLILTIGIVLMGIARNSLLPRGIRNNNPGNIRRNAIQWEGMRAIQTDDAFVQFISPEYGFRAMTRILRSYDQRGLNTVRLIISTYAPSAENHTENYIKFIANQLDTAPDSILNIESFMVNLIIAITKFENGPLYTTYYNNKIIADGIAIA